MRAGKTRLKQVADALGYSQRSISTISLWEQGRRDPPVKALEHLARIYDVPIEVFIEPDPTDEERLEERIEEIRARDRRRVIRPA